MLCPTILIMPGRNLGKNIMPNFAFFLINYRMGNQRSLPLT